MKKYFIVFIFISFSSFGASFFNFQKPFLVSEQSYKKHRDMFFSRVEKALKHEDIDFIQQEEGKSLLQIASFKGYTHIARLLIEAGAGLDIKSHGGYTALHLATSQGHSDTVEFLIRAGANLDLTSPHGYTALHMASVSEYASIVRILLNHGADFEIKDHSGQTPLARAKKRRYKKIIELLEKAKDSNCKNQF